MFRKSFVYFSFLFFVIALLLSPLTSAQETDVLREYWPNGQLKEEEPLVDGKKEGLAVYYHDNGQLYGKIPWKAGQKDGKFKLYRADGTLEQELTYLKGKKHGKLKWYDEKETLKAEENYINGVLNGEAKFYYPNGNIRAHLRYTNGKYHGFNSWYYDNGQLKVTAFYKNDVLDGTLTRYDKKGNMTAEEEYTGGSMKSQTKSSGKDKSLGNMLGEALDFLIPVIIWIIWIFWGVKKQKKDKKEVRQGRKEKAANLTKLFESLQEDLKIENYEQESPTVKTQPKQPEPFSAPQSGIQTGYDVALKARYSAVRIVGIALIVGVFVLGAAAAALIHFDALPDIGKQADQNLKYIFLAISIFSFMVMGKLRSMILGEDSRPGQIVEPVKNASLLMTKLMAATLIGYGVSELSAILGFILVMLTHQLNYYYLFGAIALIGLTKNLPHYADWEYWLNNKMIGL